MNNAEKNFKLLFGTKPNWDEVKEFYMYLEKRMYQQLTQKV